MDSTAPPGARPTILVVEGDAKLCDRIAFALGQAGYDVVIAPSGSGQAALDLLSAADFDGLYCEIQLPGDVDGWEVGAAFSLTRPQKPTAYASAVISGSPGRLRNGLFLRKPFTFERLVRVFDMGATAAQAKRQLA